MTDNTTSSPADTLSTEAELRDVYAQPAKTVLEKVFPRLDAHSRPTPSSPGLSRQ